MTEHIISSMFLDSLLSRLRRAARAKNRNRYSEAIAEDEGASLDSNNQFPEGVTIEFQDVIDLHSIPPSQVRAVVEDYIEEAHRRGVRWLRIIHGKGIGVQRETVRSILARSSFVVDFRDAPSEAGGWGATVVTLGVDDAKSPGQSPSTQRPAEPKTDSN